MKLAILLAMFSTMLIALADDNLLTALSMIETGAASPLRSRADLKIGRAGEVSRYQIHPKVWAQYANKPMHYARDPEYASKVALRILNTRAKFFMQQHDRKPSAFEIYVLWNAPKYLKSPATAPRPVIERAKRFSNIYTDLNQNYDKL